MYSLDVLILQIYGRYTSFSWQKDEVCTLSEYPAFISSNPLRCSWLVNVDLLFQCARRNTGVVGWCACPCGCCHPPPSIGFFDWWYRRHWLLCMQHDCCHSLSSNRSLAQLRVGRVGTSLHASWGGIQALSLPSTLASQEFSAVLQGPWCIGHKTIDMQCNYCRLL